jgi:F-type H+-transporting ATPase subunit a
MIQEATATPDIGEVVMHHTADAWTLDFYPFGEIHLPRWADVHLGPLTVNLSPTKHVVFLALAALLVFLTMKLAGRALERQRAGQKAPKGFAAAVEAMVLFVGTTSPSRTSARTARSSRRSSWRSSSSSCIRISSACSVRRLAHRQPGRDGRSRSWSSLPSRSRVHQAREGYSDDLPACQGCTAQAAGDSLAMAPIEIIGKLVKPFALAVRLFGNMTAGHFVILSLFGIVFLFGQLGVWSWGIGIVTASLVTGIMLLELFVAFLQAYVFALLTAVFIGLMQHEH